MKDWTDDAPATLGSSWHRARIVASLLLIGAACRRSTGSPDQQRATTPKPPGRYWLRDTTLSDCGTPPKTWHVQGPVLVELRPAGWVRTVENSGEHFEGRLPDDMLERPIWNRGLMLYARRITSIHWDRPTGPEIGRLALGAFVSVLPRPDGTMLVGVPLMDRNGPPPSSLTTYTDPDALVAGVQKLVPLEPHGPGRSFFLPGIENTFWLDAPGDGGTEVPVQLLGCRDVWIPDGSNLGFQYVDGIEVRAKADDFLLGDSWYHFPRGLHTGWCKAHAISQDADHLVQSGPNEPAHDVDSIPKGYTPAKRPRPDPLSQAILESRSIFWFATTSSGPTCHAWEFRDGRERVDDYGRRLEARLVQVQAVRADDGKMTHHWYPATLRSATDAKQAQLFLAPVHPNPWKCDCTYDYALVDTAPDELIVLGRPIPDRLVAYDPRETERWFLSEATCKRALAEAVKLLSTDGSLATQLGFHAKQGEW